MLTILNTLLKSILKNQVVITDTAEMLAVDDCTGCDDRTHEIMSGDTVQYWDDETASMQIGEFSHLYEWESPMFESPFEDECSVYGYDPVWRAIIRRWDGVLVAAVCDSVELF